MASYPLEILDTTLRDGSYVIDFQFTAEDTALIASTLESAGVPLIEIGHGLGLGAARAGKGEQAATDEDYLRAAAAALKTSRFGAFFIPGIGTETDLERAADCGAHFIRIGANVTELAQARPFIQKARDLGLAVSCNLMKSYAVPPQTFGDYGQMAEDFGAHVLCLVDSAGGMLPDDVRAYLEAARQRCALRLGFHGHNNLSMAVANALAAYDAGATVLDASLQGMGRSEGNAVTEILVAILQKRGLLTEIDVNALLDASGAFIRPLLHNKGYSGLGITSGRAKFHSSFLGRVLATAREFGVDPRDLILRVSEHDVVDSPQDLVVRLAREMAEAPPRARVRFAMPETGAPPEAAFEDQVRARAVELREKSRKYALPAVLNIVLGPFEDTHVSPFVETGFGCALSNVMVRDAERLAGALAQADGLVDYLLVDPGDALDALDTPRKSVVLPYSDTAMWARATVTHLARLLGGHLRGRVLALSGTPRLAAPAAVLFEEHGARARRGVEAELLNQAPEFDAVVVLSPRMPCIGEDFVRVMRPGAVLFDGGIGGLEAGTIPAAESRGVRVVRVDMRPTLAATALELINMKRIVEENMGRATWDGVPVVAGGLIGDEGAVIVDNITRPARVIGIADGKGGIREITGNEESVRKVSNIIAARRLEAAKSGD